MPVIKMMTIIVLVSLMAIAMGEMSEVSSSSSFVMEEESTRMTRMILNNNKSSTKFFLEENNKDEGVSCFDGLYDVPRKEENVLGKKKIKGNSEIKSQSQRRKSGWKNHRTRKEDSLSLKYVGVHNNTFHISLLISHDKWWR